MFNELTSILPDELLELLELLKLESEVELKFLMIFPPPSYYPELAFLDEGFSVLSSTLIEFILANISSKLSCF